MKIGTIHFGEVWIAYNKTTFKKAWRKLFEVKTGVSYSEAWLLFHPEEKKE